MAIFTVFGQSGGGTSVSDASTYTLGMQFTVSQPVTLTGIWFYSASGSTALPTACCIYQETSPGAGSQVTGSVNTSPSWSGAAGSGWVKVSYAAGPALLPGNNYKVCVLKDTTLLVYSATAHYWDTGTGQNGITSGLLTAPNNAGSDGGQDSFVSSVSVLTYPTSSFNANNYWIDVEVAGGSPPVYAPASPGKTWTKIFNKPAHMQPPQPAIGSVQPPNPLIAQIASPGKTWGRYFNRPVRQTPYWNFVPAVTPSGLPIQPGNTWKRRYSRPQQPYWNAGAPPPVPLPSPQINPGRAWQRMFRRHQVLPYNSLPNVNINGLTANISVAANFGNVIDQFPLPVNQVKPGRTWLRNFRKHQVFPYNSASNINISIPAANVNVAASFGTVYEAWQLPQPQIQAGRTWIRRFRQHQTVSSVSAVNTVNVSGITANINIRANFGAAIQQIPLSTYPVKPGVTWIRQFRHRQIPPYWNSAKNISVTQHANVNVRSNFGAVTESVSAQANASVTANYGIVWLPEIPATIIKPGKAWKQRFTRHQVLPYNSAANIVVSQPVANISVLAATGVTRDSVTESTALVSVAANFGVLVAQRIPVPLPANPGRTWRRIFRKPPRMILPLLANINIRGTTSSVNVNGAFGIIKVSVSGNTGKIAVSSFPGTIVYKIPVIQWGTKLLKGPSGQVYTQIIRPQTVIPPAYGIILDSE